jgi:hypothetical protein
LHLLIKVHYIVVALFGGNGGVTRKIKVMRVYLRFRDIGHILVSISYRNSRNEIVKNLKKYTKNINFMMKGYAPRISVCHLVL